MTAGSDRLSSRLLACGRDAAPLLLCIHGGGCNGRYFDLPGFSVARAALDRGWDVLLVDRPGYGKSPELHGCGCIEGTAALIPDHLAPLLAERQCPDIAVIGHSIGGAVALTLAATGRLKLSGVAVSGIGRTPSDAARDWIEERGDADTELLPEFFFGPENSFDWRGPAALRKAVEPWRPGEVEEVMLDWPGRFDAIAAALQVPVSFHFAEHERVWRASIADVDHAAARFTRSPRVQSGVLPDGGHLYEIHKRGSDLVDLQLRFLAASVSGPATAT